MFAVRSKCDEGWTCVVPIVVRAEYDESRVCYEDPATESDVWSCTARLFSAARRWGYRKCFVLPSSGDEGAAGAVAEQMAP